MAKVDRQSFLNNVLRASGLAEQSPHVAAFRAVNANGYNSDSFVHATPAQEYSSPGFPG